MRLFLGLVGLGLLMGFVTGCATSAKTENVELETCADRGVVDGVKVGRCKVYRFKD